MLKNFIAILILVALVAVPVVIKTIDAQSVNGVEVQAASESVLAPTILASGTLRYEGDVTLVSEIVARVEEVRVREGEMVQRGDVLIRFESGSFHQEIERLQANKQQTELNLEKQKVNLQAIKSRLLRYEELRAQGMIELTKFDEAETERSLAELELKVSRASMKQVEAEIAQARQKLQKTEIVSPIDGQVTSVNIRAGEIAVPSATNIPGSTLMVVSDVSSTYAEINIDEADIARVSMGQKAEIVPVAFSDQSLKGTVISVAMMPKKEGGQSKHYPVKVKLDSEQAIVFYPGMSCRAEITTSQSSNTATLNIPVQAIRYGEDGDAEETVNIFVVVDGKAVAREVTTGIADDSYIEIVSGLQKGEEIITGPPKTLRFLKHGEPVSVNAELAGLEFSGADVAGRN